MSVQETLLHLVAGSVGGATGIVAGQPFDTIKVKLQTQPSGAGAKYTGPLHCALSVVKQHGIRGLFRGVTSPVVANAPINAILFAVEHRALKLFQTWSVSKGWGDGAHHFAAGATSGLSQAPLACVSDRVKILLQVSPTHTGPLQAARAVLATGGLGSLFSGLGMTLARDVPAFGVYFATYHALKGALRRSKASPPSSGPSWLPTAQSEGRVTASSGALPPPHPAPPLGPVELMLAGGCAGTASWLLLHPVDVLKSAVQGHTPSRGEPFPPGGTLGVLRRALAAEGPSFLLRGIIPTCLRAFPASAVTFLVYEGILTQGRAWGIQAPPPPPPPSMEEDAEEWALPRE